MMLGSWRGATSRRRGAEPIGLGGTPGSAMTLSILTLNLWNNSGPYAARRELIRAWIARLNPDLIGFQEVLRGDAIDQLSDLLDGAGYQTDFEPAVPFWEDAALQFGNAVASRWPLLDREAIALPDAGDAERRVALSVTVDAPIGPVGLTVTHLNWKRTQSALRVECALW